MTKLTTCMLCFLYLAGLRQPVQAQNPNLVVAGAATYRLSLALQPVGSDVVCADVGANIKLVATVTRRADNMPVQGVTVTFTDPGTAWNPIAPTNHITAADGTAYVVFILLPTPLPGNQNLTASAIDGAQVDSATIPIVAIGGPISILGPGNYTFGPKSSDLLLRSPTSPDGPSPTVKCQRADRQQVGTAYMWSITAGADKVKIVGPSTNTDVVIQPVGPSVRYNDVTLQLQYSYKGHTCTTQKMFSVHQVKKTTFGQIAKGDNSSHVPPNWTWDRQVVYRIVSQLGLPLQNIKWDEKFGYYHDSWFRNYPPRPGFTRPDGTATDHYYGFETDTQAAINMAANPPLLDTHMEQDVIIDGVDFLWDNDVKFTYEPKVELSVAIVHAPEFGGP